MKTLSFSLLCIIWIGLILPLSAGAQIKTDGSSPLAFNRGQQKVYKSAFIPVRCPNRSLGNLFSNGPIANMQGAGFQGADASVVFSPMQIIAVPSFLPKRLIDDFEVKDKHWFIDSVAFYEVIPGGDPGTNYFSGYTVRIWDGYPADRTSKVVWGDIVTNCLTSGGFAGTYRVDETDLQSSNFPVYVNYCTLDVELPAGKYWIDWQSSPVDDLSSYSPYIACDEMLVTGNSRSYDLRSNVYLPLIDNTYPQGLPFEFFGTPGLTNTDVELLALIQPQSGLELGSQETVSVSVKNNGSKLIGQVPLQLWENSTLLVTEIATLNLLAGETAAYTFSQKLDLSAYEKTQVTVVACYPGDEFEGNDKVLAFIYHYSQEVRMHSGSVATTAALFTDSGGSSGNYGDNENFEFSFFPATNQPNPRMRVKFHQLDTEMIWDSLYIYDGPTRHSPLLYVFNGGNVPGGPEAITATNVSGSLTFVFRSDEIFNRPGWIADVECYLPKDNDLAAININGSNFCALGREQYYEVTIKNEGNQLQNDYNVRVLDEEGNVLGSVQGPAIQFDEKMIVEVPIVIPEAKAYIIHAYIDFENDENPVNNATNNHPLQVTNENEMVVEVPDDNLFTNEFPLNPGFRSSLAEVIYYPVEINASGLISSINYKYKFWENNVSIPVRIWMGHTELENLTDTWIPSSELQLVYDGNLHTRFGLGIVGINFDSSFYYNGTSNLVVMVERRFSYTIFPGHISWGPNEFAMQEDTIHEGRSRFWKTNVSLIHPENPRVGTASNIVPYTAFTFDVSNEGRLKGVVTNLTGEPVAGVTLSLEGTNLRATSTFNGTYIFNDLPQGVHQLKAGKFTYNDTTTMVNIIAGQQMIQNLQITEKSISFVSGAINFFDRPWEMAAGAEVTLSGYDTIIVTTTNETGFFCFENIYTNANYQLRIIYPDYQVYETGFFLPPSGLSLPIISLLEVTASPSGVTAVETSDTVEVSWEEGSSSYEISYDDGMPDGQICLYDEGWAYAMRFTPLGYPCRIEKVMLHLAEKPVPANELYPFLIEVYDDDGPNGIPGTLLGTVEKTANNYGWNEFDISGLNLQITEGEFFVAQRQMGPLNLRAELSTDNSAFELGRAYQNNLGSTWWGQQNFNKYMIRTWVRGTSEDRSAEGYNVYRLNMGQENQTENWVMMSENQAENHFTDDNWNALNWGLFRYAVKTSYSSGLLSDPAFSNVLAKDANVYCNILVTSNAGYLPDDAFVYISRTENDSTITASGVPINGMLSLGQLIRGSYLLQVTSRLFDNWSDTVILSSDTTLEVVLLEKALPACYVYAEDQSSQALISWFEGPEIDPVILDDGWPEGNFSSNSALDSYFGNRYHFNSQAILMNASVYFEFNPEFIETQVHLDVFNTDKQWIGSSGILAVEPESWNVFTFPDLEISGDFFVMIHFEFADFPHYACFDQNGPNTGNNLGYACIDGQWMLIKDLVPGISDGVMMIRPVLYTGDERLPQIYGNRCVDEHAVYRLMAGDENNHTAWEWLVNTSEITCADTTWNMVIPGYYRYAVETHYSSGVVAYAAFSEIIEKGQIAAVEVQVTTNSGDSAEGAQVVLSCNDNNPQHIYSGVINAQGDILFGEVWKGYYSLEINLGGYENYTLDNLYLISDNCSLQAILTEIIMTPVNLSVTQQDDTSAIFEWDTRADNTKHILGYNVYLDDLTTPVAFVLENSYLLGSLETNVNYLAGVSAVFSSGTSQIQTVAFLLLPVGTGDVDNEMITVYPTFSAGSVCINANTIPEYIVVSDMKGTSLLTISPASNQSVINLANLPKGMYLIKIQVCNSQVIRKVVHL